ncbi:MAG: response regulator transcription factor, partial [Solirubrobacterales bacterium]|nr:response regulator transcription factor [Solirubrobacterales bacterium]
MTGAPIRILLIDDHAVFRQPLTFMLEREPDLTVVAQAGSLQEAREILAAQADSIDLALVDLRLPDGLGIELVRELREVNPEAHSVVLTADTDRVLHARALEAGAS